MVASGSAYEVSKNFHGYPSRIHRLTYNRTNHRNIHAGDRRFAVAVLRRAA